MRRRRLPPLANVIDYGRSDMRSDWMDVFLLTRSRFVRGSASGPIFVPPLYVVPSVLTHWWPPGMRPWHAHDIYIPKLAKRAADATYLTLSETLREPVSYCHSLRHLAAEAGLAVEDNDPVRIESMKRAAFRLWPRLASEFLRRHGDFAA
jgi:putative glycosyltransferase (TIGR04372 family)